MPPNYVKAYVKRNKHDVADAEAICEAVRRPSMRFVPLKTTEQQSALMMHRARDLLIRQRRPTDKASIRGNHQGRRSSKAAPKGRPHDCKRPVSLTEKTLASWGPMAWTPPV